MARKIAHIALVVMLGLGLGVATAAPAHAGRGITGEPTVEVTPVPVTP